MHRLLFPIAVMIAGLALVTIGYRLQQQRQTRAVTIEPAVYDWGVVTDPRELRAEYRIKNGSNRPVRIRSIELSCSCSAAKINQRRLLPGESATLTIKADPGANHGPFVVSARVLTDHPSYGILGLWAVGTIVRSRLDLPYDIGYVPAGRTSKHSVKVAGKGHLLDASVAEANAETDVRITAAQGQYWSIDLIVTPSRAQRHYEATLELTAKGHSWKKAVLHVRGRVVEVWQYPREVFLGAARSAQQQTVRIRLREGLLEGADQPQGRARVLSAPSWLTARIAGRSAHEYILTVSANPKAAYAARLRGKVVVQMPDVLGESDRVEISVYAIGHWQKRNERSGTRMKK